MEAKRRSLLPIAPRMGAVIASKMPSRRFPPPCHAERPPFLAGQAFESDVIREMSLALESVCKALELSLIDDPATTLRRRLLN
jgi:hypothetical protein